MSLNIKSERVVALVRELATRVGTSQTSAVEDAVARRLAGLDRERVDRDDRRRLAAREALEHLRSLLTDDDVRAIRGAEEELYDDAGLPR